MTMPGGANDRQVNVTLNANVDPYVRSLTAANQATLKLGDSLKRIDDYMLKLTKRVGIGMTAVGTGGVLSTFGDVKTAAAMQQSFASLAAQATQTGTSVGTITTQVQKLGTSVPVATASLAAMATQIAALGITGTKNIISLTKQAEQLAAATNTAPGQLFTQLIQMNQSLGGSIQNLERYGSALTSIQQNMGVSASATLDMANSIQAVGQKAGISEQNLLGIASAFVKVGADGTTGAQAFNQVVNAMTDAVSRSSDSMKTFSNVMGITVGQFQTLVQRDPTQAFVQFIDAISAQGQRASITLQALGLDSVRTQRVFAALTSGQANLSSALAQSNQAFQANTATSTAAAAAWDTLNSKITELKNSAGNIKDALGAPLLAVFQPVTEALTGLTKGVTSFIHLTNDAPWPIGDTLTALVTKAPALLVLGGAFLTLTAAVAKFAGTWRLLTGMVGVNAFRGFMDARRGRGPRDVQEELTGVGGRVGSALYRSSFALGRGNSDYGVNARRGLGSLIAGYPLMRARQQLNQSLDTMLHPLSPEARSAQMTDPLSMYGMAQSAQRYGKNARAGLVLRLRNPNASPMQQALANRLEEGFGEFDQSPEGIRRRRFQYVESVRHQATVQQRAVNATLGRNDLVDVVGAGEAARYYERMGTLDGYNPTDYSRMSLGRLRKLSNRQALAVGDRAATSAGKAFDASLTEEETAKMANPFQKLANKVKEITADLTKTTSAATKNVFEQIQVMFQQAMAKIIAMAQQAKAQIASVQGIATGTVNPMIGPLPPVPGAAGGVRVDDTAARQTARIQAEETAKVVKTSTALLSPEEMAATAVIGFPVGTRVGGIGPRRGPLSVNRLPGDYTRGVPVGMEEGGTAAGVARFRSVGQAVAGRDSWLRSNALPAAGEAASSFGRGLLQAGAAVKDTLGMFMSPQLMIGATLLGPAIWQLAQKIIQSHNAIASSTDYYGAATQTQLGRQVLTPTQIAQQRQASTPPNSDLFGPTAISNSAGGTFLDNHSALLTELQSIENSNLSKADKLRYEQMIFQQEAIGDVNQNGGTPLDTAQRQDLATLALAFTNQNAGRARMMLGGSDLSAIDTTGNGGNAFYGDMSKLFANNSVSGSNRQQLLKAFGGQAATSYATQGQSLAGFLYTTANTQQLTGGNVFSQDKANANYGAVGARVPVPRTTSGPLGFGNRQTQDVIKAFIDNYNANQPKGQQLKLPETPDSIQGFYSELQAKSKQGDQVASNLLRSFNSLGLTFDKTGALTKQSLDALALAASGAANALKNPTTTGVSEADNTRMAQTFNQVTLGKGHGSLLDMLNTPDSEHYTTDITRTLQALSGASNQGVFDPKNAEALRSEAEAIGQLKSQVQQGSAQWQQLDQLQQGVFQQLSQVPLMSGQGFTGQLRAQVSTLQDYVNGQFTDATSGDYNAQLQATTQMAQQGVSQLQQYYMQVKDAHINMQRAAQDHHTQMVRSERDYNRQIAEAQYQFGIQQSEQTYQYNLNNTEQLYQFNEQIRQMKYSLANAFGTAGSQVQAQYTMGAQSALTGFGQQTNDLQRSQQAMDKLKTMGLSNDVIRVFKLDDPTNFQQAERYLSDFVSNPQLIQSFNDMVAKNLNISQAIASDPNNSQFADLQRQFDHTSQLAAQSFTHSAQVAAAAFAHSMSQAKQSYDIQMQDFQSDYNLQTQRSLDDLSRLGQETQMTWQQLVTWAQQSGIPAIAQLASATQDAISGIQAAVDGINSSLQALGPTFNTTIAQVSQSLQSWMNANPAIGRAFAAANGIDTSNGGNLSQPRSAVQQAVQAQASIYGWGSGAEWTALSNIISAESGWNPQARNPGSGAAGLFQKMPMHGPVESTVQGQADWGLTYIQQRYTDPIKAWNFHLNNGWYANGGVFDKASVIGVGEAGPEAVLPLDSRGAAFMAQTLRASLQMMMPNLATEVRRGRTIASPLSSEMHYHHTDASTNFTGEITVVAQDPNEMARKLAAKTRLQRLKAPVK